jgi:hypothetical protein
MKSGALWLSQPPVAQPAGPPPSFAMIGLVFSGAPADSGRGAALPYAGLESIERHREVRPDKPPILVFGPHLDLLLARDALRAGASGFVHAGMIPNQLLRAVAVATKDELVAPRELLIAVVSAVDPLLRPLASRVDGLRSGVRYDTA